MQDKTACASPVEREVRPIGWVVRHKLDVPAAPLQVYTVEADAIAHANSFVPGCASVVAIGDIDAAVAAERERCKRAVYDATDWAHEERDFTLKEAIVEWIENRPNH